MLSETIEVGAGLPAYARILRHGPALRPFAAATVARLPVSMAPLGLILLIQHVRGAYGIAGLVTGAYALGTAAGSPVWGRCMDRYGQPRVIAPTALVSAGLLVALTLGAVGGAGNPVLLVLAAAAGIAFPPVGPAMRAAWRVVFADPGSQRVGYALDASVVELIFVGGPLLLSLLLVVAPPVVPLLVTAGFLAGGGITYSFTGAARACRAHPRRRGGTERRRRPRLPRPARLAAAAPGVVAVLVVMGLMSVGFGQVDTSLAATARQVLGDPARLGALFAAIAGGSAIGGLWYGAHSWAGHEQRRLPVALGAFTLALVPLPLLMLADRPPLWLLLPLLFLAGLSIAPALIMQQNILDTLAPRHRLNEAQALLTAANTTGAAAGTAVAGFLIDLGGVPWAFTGAVLALAASSAVAVRSQRHWAVSSPGR